MSIINLLPDDYLKRQHARRTNGVCLLLFAIVMAGVLTAVSLNQRSVNNTQAVLTRVNAEYEDAAKLIEKLRQLEQQNQTVAHKAEVTTSLLEHQPRSYIMAMVTNALPETACVETLKLYPKRVIVAPEPPPTSTKVKVRRAKAEKQEVVLVELELTGLAATDVDVSALMANLSLNPLAQSVDLAFSQDKQIEIKEVNTEKILEKKTFREFQIRMVLKKDVDVLDVIAESKKMAAANATSGGAL